MQLRYYRNATGNFGDDINAWFWNRVAPGLVDDNPSHILIGLGTILGSWFTDDLPAQSLKIVLGAGAGKRGNPLDFSQGWKVYGVRGPLTAAICHLDSSYVLTDPAMLLRDFDDMRLERQVGKVGFMPHIWSTDHWDWRRLCERLGLVYIDPHGDAVDTIRSISTLERLITEAMHGAIVADALRTPWVAVSISPFFEGLKWCDWAGSLNMPVFFHNLPELYNGGEGFTLDNPKASVKRAMARVGIFPSRHARSPSTSWEVKDVERRLTALSLDPVSQLSDLTSQDAAIRRTYIALDQLRSDFIC